MWIVVAASVVAVAAGGAAEPDRVTLKQFLTLIGPLGRFGVVDTYEVAHQARDLLDLHENVDSVQQCLQEMMDAANGFLLDPDDDDMTVTLLHKADRLQMLYNELLQT